MTFYRPDEEEIKCSSWDALRRHIADCHKEIDRLQSRSEQIESLHRDAERSASLAFEGDGAILPSFGRVGESKVRLVVRLAEAYRDLLATVEFGKPYKVTIGDVETWHNLPVLVPVGLIPTGRTPCEVRSYALPFQSEWMSPRGGLMNASMVRNQVDCGLLSILLADKTTQRFEIGKYYKNRRGEIRGPLEKSTSRACGNEKTHPLSDGGLVYTLDGDRKKFDPNGMSDLVPGAVDPPPTWVPWPWLPDGEYSIRGNGLMGCGQSFCLGVVRKWRGYTSDPPIGRWQVTSGTATYLGEA